jgi:hypothetical protein
LVIYADDAAIVATYCKPTVIVSYLESCFNDLKLSLRKWIALNFSKSTAVLFVKIGGRISKPRLVQLFGKSINWADTVCYLGVTLNKQRTWRGSKHVEVINKIDEMH